MISPGYHSTHYHCFWEAYSQPVTSTVHKEPAAKALPVRNHREGRRTNTNAPTIHTPESTS